MAATSSQIGLKTCDVTLFLFLLLPNLFMANEIYHPNDVFSISCGSSNNLAVDGRNWTADINTKFLSETQNNHSVAANAIIPTTIQGPYTSVRVSYSQLTYSFPVTTSGHKFIRLFFYPTSYQNFDPAKAFFSVKSGDYTLLKDFNASLYVDADDDPSGTFFKEYSVYVQDSHKTLNISFIPSTLKNHTDSYYYAFINGIEVVSMPPYLCHTNVEQGGTVVMALKCRGHDVFDGLYTGISTKHIFKTSKMVEEYTGLHLQPHKALVGANAFVHESGIHQDGWLKHKATYEIIPPESIGLERSSGASIVLGKLSGRHALRNRLEELGHRLKDDEVASVFLHFKAMADKKKRVTDADLIALVSNEVAESEHIWKLGDLEVTCGTLGPSKATIRLIAADGNAHVACFVGSGSVDSAFKAVNLIVKEPVELLEYSVTIVTESVDAIATTCVVIRRENNHASTPASTEENVYPTFSGIGAGKDVVISSVKAYIAALNKMLGSKK